MMHGMAPKSPMAKTSIQYNLTGIAALLKMGELQVPIYQRSYCWSSDEEVADFWADVKSAFEDNGEYFLGTIVLTADGDAFHRTVIDGQQRLVTASLLLAAIRDELHERGGDKWPIIQSDYLASEDMYSEGNEPKLTLNPEDDDHFRAIIFETPAKKLETGLKREDEFIFNSFSYLRQKVKEMANYAGGGAISRLRDLVTFLEKWTCVGIVEVPTEADAYVIFEALNNRGADLTTADLLKNYLFGRSGKELEKVRNSWAKATGAIDTTNATFIAFLRHYWSSLHGPTRERDLYKEIKRTLTTQSKAVTFARDLAEAAWFYAAIGNSDHEYWNTHGTAGKVDVSLLGRFNLAPTKPLLMAAMKHFSDQELRKLTRSLVSWTVRGMIFGDINSRNTEDRYCSAAMKIREGKILKVSHVRSELISAIPGDNDFREAFAIAKVSKNRDARYYLRALERGLAKTSDPELVPNEDEEQVNLEHILPRNCNPNQWPGFNKEELSSWALRVGNMALLSREENKKIGNKPFLDKKEAFSKSKLQLTQEVGNKQDWSMDEVTKRQQRLAELAVKVWPRGD